MGAVPRSIEMFPKLCASSFFDTIDPSFEEGRDAVLLRMNDLMPLSRLELRKLRGLFGAVTTERPLGGFAVRMTGEEADSSSRDVTDGCRES